MIDSQSSPDSADILDRLEAHCVGRPYAKIEWPHRLLHDAVAEIERLRSAYQQMNDAFIQASDAAATPQCSAEIESALRAALQRAQKIIERDFPNGLLAIDIRNVLALRAPSEGSDASAQSQKELK